MKEAINVDASAAYKIKGEKKADTLSKSFLRPILAQNGVQIMIKIENEQI